MCGGGLVCVCVCVFTQMMNRLAAGVQLEVWTDFRPTDPAQSAVSEHHFSRRKLIYFVVLLNWEPSSSRELCI